MWWPGYRANHADLDELLEPEIFEQGVKPRVKQRVVKGQRELLLSLLVHRFGALPESVNRRVADASAKKLARWGERILDGASLDDVFAAL